jgi:NADPH:quinone reductase-like Zn-dependent oxidoreductase
MKAIVCGSYGRPEVLRLKEVDRPQPAPDEVLVRVCAAGVSVSDCVVRSGKVKPLMWIPFRIFVGWRGPRHPILGMDLSGEIQAVGASVTQWQPGDAIFAFTGRRFGAYAEYACLRDGGRYVPSDCVIARKPTNISHAEAATAPSRGMLALHFLEDAGIRRGQRVLIYGASSGIGTFAVQLAKHFGAEVTAVAGPAHLDLVRSLGPDSVLDYSVNDGCEIDGPYDLVFDAVGKSKTSALKSACVAALARGGKSLSVDRAARIPAHRLDTIRELIDGGVIRPVVDRVYPLEQAAQAHRYVESRHKGGGVAIDVASP